MIDKGFYKDGKLEGYYYKYNNKGKLIQKRIYKDGNLKNDLTENFNLSN